MGHIPDGTFGFIDGAVKILAAPQRTVDELRTLALILEDARAGRINQKETIEQIEETVPGLQQVVAALLPNTKNALVWIGTLATVIAVLIALLTLFRNEPSQITVTHNTDIDISIERGLSDAELQEIIEKVYEQIFQADEP